MHELAICQSLMNQVEAIAAENDAVNVKTIVVGIGPLSGVEAILLERAYPMASIGTVAETAELVIESLPVKVSCSKCGNETIASPNKLTCKHCGDWQTTLISGDELLLLSLELDRQADAMRETVH